MKLNNLYCKQMIKNKRFDNHICSKKRNQKKINYLNQMKMIPKDQEN
jgi:hypothetical protein